MNESPVVVAGIQVPSDPEAPITLDFRAHALRMAIVDRHRVSRLPAGDWDAPGVYVLVDPPAQPEITVYVGQARKLRHRLGHHARRREGWWRALAVQRDDRHGFNTAEIGYLEGRLTSELKALPGTAVDAGKADIDTTLPQHERAHLDAFVPTILAGLRVVGLRSEHETPSAARKARTWRRVEGSVGDLLAAGLLTAGTELAVKKAGHGGTAVVTATGELLVEGKAYSSPSSAAVAALPHRKSANGWTAWRLDDGNGPSLADLRDQLEQPRAHE